MASLRRFLLRRYRLFAPQLFRQALLLLVVLLICDGIAALCWTQVQTALSLKVPLAQNSAVMPADGTGIDMQAVLARDDFRRTNQVYWGTSSGGQSWQADAQEKRSFSIAADQGVVAPTQGFLCGVLGQSVTDSEVSFQGSLSQFRQSSLAALLRWDSPENYYKLVLDAQGLTLSRVMDGMPTPLRTVSFTPRDGASYTFLFRAAGTQLSAMIWPSGQPAPADWQISLADSALQAGQAGVGAYVQVGVQARISDFKEIEL